MIAIEHTPYFANSNAAGGQHTVLQAVETLSVDGGDELACQETE